MSYMQAIIQVCIQKCPQRLPWFYRGNDIMKGMSLFSEESPQWLVIGAGCEGMAITRCGILVSCGNHTLIYQCIKVKVLWILPKD